MRGSSRRPPRRPLCPGGFDLLDPRLAPRGVAAGDDDRRAGLRQPLRQRPAEDTRPADDDRHLTREPEQFFNIAIRHRSPFLRGIRLWISIDLDDGLDHAGLGPGIRGEVGDQLIERRAVSDPGPGVDPPLLDVLDDSLEVGRHRIP